MIQERVKFYADTPAKQINKYFVFNCTILNFQDLIARFWIAGFNIRAAWYESFDTETKKVLNNSKINIQAIINKIDNNGRFNNN